MCDGSICRHSVFPSSPLPSCPFPSLLRMCYKVSGCLVRNCPRLIYRRSESRCLLPRLVDQLLVPVSNPHRPALSNASSNVKRSLHHVRHYITASRHCAMSLHHVTAPRHCTSSLHHITAPRHCITSLHHVTASRHCTTSLHHVTAPRHCTSSLHLVTAPGHCAMYLSHHVTVPWHFTPLNSWTVGQLRGFNCRALR